MSKQKRTPPGLKRAGLLIATERNRQREKGYSERHDDSHTDGSILRCAISVARDVAEPTKTPLIPGDWPSERANHIRKKYRGNRIRRLVIAAALLQAEIDRLIRRDEADRRVVKGHRR